MFGNPKMMPDHRINNRILFADVEVLKKNEIQRRRALRLLQVRQQSKDLAHQIRERWKDEKSRHVRAHEIEQKEVLREQDFIKCTMLRQQFLSNLETIGQGHKEAAMQPDPDTYIAAETKRWRQIAGKRGQMAIKQLQTENAEVERKLLNAEKHRVFVRTVENIRSSVVASLPKKTTSSTYSCCRKSTKTSPSKIPQRDSKNKVETNIDHPTSALRITPHIPPFKGQKTFSSSISASVPLGKTPPCVDSYINKMRNRLAKSDAISSRSARLDGTRISKETLKKIDEVDEIEDIDCVPQRLVDVQSETKVGSKNPTVLRLRGAVGVKGQPCSSRSNTATDNQCSEEMTDERSYVLSSSLSSQMFSKQFDLEQKNGPVENSQLSNRSESDLSGIEKSKSGDQNEGSQSTEGVLTADPGIRRERTVVLNAADAGRQADDWKTTADGPQAVPLSSSTDHLPVPRVKDITSTSGLHETSSALPRYFIHLPSVHSDDVSGRCRSHFSTVLDAIQEEMSEEEQSLLACKQMTVLEGRGSSVNLGSLSLVTDQEPLSDQEPSSRESAGRVLLYDHANRFHHSYDPSANVTVSRLVPNAEPDAREQAARERTEGAEATATKVSEAGVGEANTRDRGQEALRRLRLQREYQTMIHTLDHLSRRERISRAVAGIGNPIEAHVSDMRLKTLQEQRQQNIATAFQNLIGGGTAQEWMCAPGHKPQMPSSSLAATSKPLRCISGTGDGAFLTMDASSKNDDDRSAAAALNVGTWTLPHSPEPSPHGSDTSGHKLERESVTSSESSIILPAPLQPPQRDKSSDSASRCENPTSNSGARGDGAPDAADRTQKGDSAAQTVPSFASFFRTRVSATEASSAIPEATVPLMRLSTHASVSLSEDSPDISLLRDILATKERGLYCENAADELRVRVPGDGLAPRSQVVPAADASRSVTVSVPDKPHTYDLPGKLTDGDDATISELATRTLQDKTIEDRSLEVQRMEGGAQRGEGRVLAPHRSSPACKYSQPRKAAPFKRESQASTSQRSPSAATRCPPAHRATLKTSASDVPVVQPKPPLNMLWPPRRLAPFSPSPPPPPPTMASSLCASTSASSIATLPHAWCADKACEEEECSSRRGRDHDRRLHHRRWVSSLTPPLSPRPSPLYRSTPSSSPSHSLTPTRARSFSASQSEEEEDEDEDELARPLSVAVRVDSKACVRATRHSAPTERMRLRVSVAGEAAATAAAMGSRPRPRPMPRRPPPPRRRRRSNVSPRAAPHQAPASRSQPRRRDASQRARGRGGGGGRGGDTQSHSPRRGMRRSPGKGKGRAKGKADAKHDSGTSTAYVSPPDRLSAPRAQDVSALMELLRCVPRQPCALAPTCCPPCPSPPPEPPPGSSRPAFPPSAPPPFQPARSLSPTSTSPPSMSSPSKTQRSHTTPSKPSRSKSSRSKSSRSKSSRSRSPPAKSGTAKSAKGKSATSRSPKGKSGKSKTAKSATSRPASVKSASSKSVATMPTSAAPPSEPLAYPAASPTSPIATVIPEPSQPPPFKPTTCQPPPCQRPPCQRPPCQRPPCQPAPCQPPPCQRLLTCDSRRAYDGPCSLPPPPPPLDPLLARYVARLLSMSKASVDALDVSTDVEASTQHSSSGRESPAGGEVCPACSNCPYCSHDAPCPSCFCMTKPRNRPTSSITGDAGGIESSHQGRSQSSRPPFEEGSPSYETLPPSQPSQKSSKHRGHSPPHASSQQSSPESHSVGFSVAPAQDPSPQQSSAHPTSAQPAFTQQPSATQPQVQQPIRQLHSPPLSTPTASPASKSMCTCAKSPQSMQSPSPSPPPPTGARFARGAPQQPLPPNGAQAASAPSTWMSESGSRLVDSTLPATSLSPSLHLDSTEYMVPPCVSTPCRPRRAEAPPPGWAGVVESPPYRPPPCPPRLPCPGRPTCPVSGATGPAGASRPPPLPSSASASSTRPPSVGAPLSPLPSHTGSTRPASAGAPRSPLPPSSVLVSNISDEEHAREAAFHAAADNVAELSERCARRIQSLARLIDDVRREKDVMVMLQQGRGSSPSRRSSHSVSSAARPRNTSSPPPSLSQTPLSPPPLSPHTSQHNTSPRPRSPSASSAALPRRPQICASDCPSAANRRLLCAPQFSPTAPVLQASSPCPFRWTVPCRGGAANTPSSSGGDSSPASEDTLWRNTSWRVDSPARPASAPCAQTPPRSPPPRAVSPPPLPLPSSLEKSMFLPPDELPPPPGATGDRARKPTVTSTQPPSTLASSRSATTRSTTTRSTTTRSATSRSVTSRSVFSQTAAQFESPSSPESSRTSHALHPAPPPHFIPPSEPCTKECRRPPCLLNLPPSHLSPPHLSPSGSLTSSWSPPRSSPPTAPPLPPPPPQPLSRSGSAGPGTVRRGSSRPAKPPPSAWHVAVPKERQHELSAIIEADTTRMTGGAADSPSSQSSDRQSATPSPSPSQSPSPTFGGRRDRPRRSPSPKGVRPMPPLVVLATVTGDTAAPDGKAVGPKENLHGLLTATHAAANRGHPWVPRHLRRPIPMEDPTLTFTPRPDSPPPHPDMPSPCTSPTPRSPSPRSDRSHCSNRSLCSNRSQPSHRSRRSDGSTSPAALSDDNIDIVAELIRRGVMTSPFAWMKRERASAQPSCGTPPPCGSPPSRSRSQSPPGEESSPSTCLHVEISPDSSGSGAAGDGGLQSPRPRRPRSRGTCPLSRSSHRHRDTSVRSSSSDRRSNATSPTTVPPGTGGRWALPRNLSRLRAGADYERDDCTDPEDLEAVFSSLGLGWAAAMLRKTQEAMAISSSSSDAPTLLDASSANTSAPAPAMALAPAAASAPALIPDSALSNASDASSKDLSAPNVSLVLKTRPSLPLL